MSQALLIEDVRPALLAAEQARETGLRELIVLLERAEQADMSRADFTELFSLSVRQLELDQETVARSFKISRPTISRWESGASAPHPLGRKPVFRLLRNVAKEKLRRHQTVAAF